jgi:hypothetical protein
MVVKLNGNFLEGWKFGSRNSKVGWRFLKLGLKAMLGFASIAPCFRGIAGSTPPIHSKKIQSVLSLPVEELTYLR